MMEAMYEVPSDPARKTVRVTLPLASHRLENSEFALMRKTLKAS
jgi:hypothetical protein